MATSQATTTTSQAIHKLVTLNGDQVLEYYENWAGSYDTDVKSSNYKGPLLCAEALGKMLSAKNTPIVDCAAGTGISGEELKNVGFQNIDAVDFSQSSLDISASKGVYRQLICDKFDENKIEKIEDDTYGGLACVGGLGSNHITSSAYAEWNRIVKHGGIMVFTVSRVKYDASVPDHHSDVRNGIQELVDKQVWQLIDKTVIPYHSDYQADMFTIRLNKMDQ